MTSNMRRFESVASLVLLLSHSVGFLFASSEDPTEDARLTISELITKYGYPIEEHFVTTSDGYILRLHRIRHGTSSNVTSRRVVFLQHGILSSSADWIITGPNNGLAYLLAEEGYDVWMGNARGNTQSRNHTTLDPDKDSAYWRFSWHQIGTVDLPTMIDYVLDVTGQTSLYHVGHSQGTTTFYVMNSVHPEYNSKIRAHFSLAPIAYMNHMTSPLLHIMAFWSGPLELLTKLIGLDEFLPSNDLLAMVGETFCSDSNLTQVLCTNSMFVICGFSPDQMNATILPVLMAHTPAGSSTEQLLHYAQEINSGRFRQYDYGLRNLGTYGSLTPPNYNLSLTKAPVYLVYSHNDWLAAERDVDRLCEELGSACQEKLLVADDKFNHLDYLYGIDAPELVYKSVIQLMAKS